MTTQPSQQAIDPMEHGAADPPPAHAEPQPAPTGRHQDDQQAAVSLQEPSGGEKLVPVSESIRYRRRAQAAEQETQRLREALDQANASLRQTSEALESAERRQRVDQLLVESEVVDLEAARLLTEAAIATMDDADVAAVVDDLRQRKPYLFKRNETGRAMSARPRHAKPGTGDAAEQAARTGDRTDLLHYLRMRRRGGNAS
jgi:hypothetical protein